MNEPINYQSLTESELSLLASAISEVVSLLTTSCTNHGQRLPHWATIADRTSDRMLEILTAREKQKESR